MNPGDRYIILEVEYSSIVHYGRSLGWLASALKDSRLKITEDMENAHGHVIHRKWAGYVTAEEWDRLASEWSISFADSVPNMGMLTEEGFMESYAFNWGGMDWNVGGETPIDYVSLYASVQPEDEHVVL